MPVASRATVRWVEGEGALISLGSVRCHRAGTRCLDAGGVVWDGSEDASLVLVRSVEGGREILPHPLFGGWQVGWFDT